MPANRTDFCIVGAGPAGLAAAIEAARRGVRVAVFDEQTRPGGQLVKQLHKFFGSYHHYAGRRGFQIGVDLFEQARRVGAIIHLESTVWGLFPDRSLGVRTPEGVARWQAERVLLATGALENPIAFPGWTLPGVMGAGAAQTLMNQHRVLPGRNVLMVGSGNVGLIVAYQLLQAGANVVAVVEIAPGIGGYGVHAAKLTRAGVPLMTGSTIVRAEGEVGVERAWVARVDHRGRPVSGTEVPFDVDLVCVAVGLSPMVELARVVGCEFVHVPDLGGYVPLHDSNLRTSVPWLHIAGDSAGVEEGSTALEEGRLAGLAVAESLGKVSPDDADSEREQIGRRLSGLRSGSFGQARRWAKMQIATRESHRDSVRTARTARLSHENTLLRKQGFLEDGQVRLLPGVPGVERLERGPVAVIECSEDIPCDPCAQVCPQKAITISPDITALPRLDSSRCNGCGLCVPACPGLAIFVVDMSGEGSQALVGLPYEFLRLPKKGDRVAALARDGSEIGEVVVEKVLNPQRYGRTAVVYIRVAKDQAMQVRGIRTRGS